MQPFEAPRRHSRGFELFMQLSYVSMALVASAWGDPTAKAIIDRPDPELADILEAARKEYDALDRIERIGRNRRRLQRRRSVA